MSIGDIRTVKGICQDSPKDVELEGYNKGNEIIEIRKIAKRLILEP